jgi:hypothetical protein
MVLGILLKRGGKVGVDEIILRVLGGNNHREHYRRSIRDTTDIEKIRTLQVRWAQMQTKGTLLTFTIGSSSVSDQS